MKYAYNLKLPDLFRNKDVDFIFVGFEDSNNNLIHRVDVKQFTSKPILFKFNSDNKPTYVVYWGYKDSWLDDYKIVENLIDDLSINTRVKFFISGDLGDIIYCLPTIKALGGGDLYIGGNYAPLPVRSQIDANIFKSIEPVLTQQEYIYNAYFCDTPPSNHINLNRFKSKYIEIPTLSNVEIDILRKTKITKLFSDLLMLDDRSDECWLKCQTTKQLDTPIIINRTNRYNDESFPWKQIVNKYNNLLTFVGTEDEYKKFTTKFGNVSYIKTPHIDELFQIIAGCQLFIGNQSFCYSLAEGLKKPCIQESDKWFKNCQHFRNNALIFKDGEPYDFNCVSKFIQSHNIGINLSNIVINNKKKILYIGQTGTSGYAKAAKGYILDLIESGHDVEWLPQRFDDSCESNNIVDTVCEKYIIETPDSSGYDEIYLHTTPDMWGDYISIYNETCKNAKIIGISVWETSSIPTSWVGYINSTVHELIVPSRFNKEIYKHSGIIIPIIIKPHYVYKSNLPTNYTIVDYKGTQVPTDRFTYYNISEFTERKGVTDLINVFASVYGSRTDVQLVIKTHFKDYSSDNINYCINNITKYIKTNNVYLIVEKLSEIEKNVLHDLGDVYISLHRGEAYGLTIAEAHLYDNKVITTKYGGHLDYLGDNYPYLVDYSLRPVNMKEFNSHWYTPDQFWGIPDLNHAKQLMSEIYL
jgi:glycosyltransferase involved in cell wall biosynthesis